MQRNKLAEKHCPANLATEETAINTVFCVIFSFF